MNKIRSFLVLFLMFAIFISAFAKVYADEGDDEDYSYDSNYFSPGTETNPTPVLKMSGDGILAMEKGETRDVEIPIKNVSSFYAYNILIQPVASGGSLPYNVEVLEKSNTKYYLQSTATMRLKLRITIDDKAKAGTYPLNLNYTFTAKDKSGFTGSDTLYIKVGGEYQRAELRLKDFSKSAERTAPGGNVTISASLANEGSCDVENITVALSGLGADTIGMEEGSSTYSIGSLKKGESKAISFKLIAAEELKSGSYPLSYKLTYEDGEGKEVTKEYGYYINVLSERDGEEKAAVDCEITQPEGTYSVGQSFSVKVKLKNNGDRQAENITVAAGGDKDGAVVPRSTSVKQMKSLGVGEEQSFLFDFAANSQAATQNYPISFDIEYETGAKTDEGSEVRKFTQYTGVNIYNPDKKQEEKEQEEKKTSTPKIIISRYECTPVMAEAGQTFDINMTFKNTHAAKAVKNIKLYLTVNEETEKKGNVFTPNGCSNTYYIDEIKPKAEVSHSFSMFTVPDADARTYTLNVNFEYEDGEYNEYKSTELVGINVRQKAELTTGDIIAPTEGCVGEPLSIAFDLYNTGKVTLSNVMVRVEGEGLDTSGAAYYAGTMEQGLSDMYEGSVTPLNLGESKGKIIISYEDSSGKAHEKTQEFTLSASEPVYDEEPIENTEEADKGTGRLPLFIGLGIGAAVIIVIIILFVIRRKRRDFDIGEGY